MLQKRTIFLSPQSIFLLRSLPKTNILVFPSESLTPISDATLGKVIKDLNRKKIDMLWGDVYPFCEVENDINNECMYIVEFEENIIGSFVLSDFDEPDYHNIEWKINGKKAVNGL